MDRVWLEVLKCLSASEVLSLSTTSHYWHTLCSHDELWLHLLGPGLNQLRLLQSPVPSLQAAYRTEHTRYLVVPRAKTLHRYFPATQTWKITRLRVDWEVCFRLEMAPLGTNAIFCCGGENPQVDTFSVSLITGRGEILPCMQPHRMHTGLYVDDIYVYSFCGRLNSDLTSICTRFNRISSQWEPIPSACNARQCFTPVRHLQYVYIAGGFPPSVECFDPATLQFQLLPIEYGLRGSVDIVIWQEKLCILNLFGRYVWDFQRQEGELYKIERAIYRGTSCFPPICKESSCLFVWYCGYQAEVYEMDLQTLGMAVVGFQKSPRKKRKRQRF